MSSIYHNSKSTLINCDILDTLSIIKRGCAELLPEKDLIQKLVNAKEHKRPLRIKLGLDPTAKDIHLGHAVVLTKLRQLQELGHTVIFLVGDFTAQIGDPTGRNEMRPIITEEEITYNAQTYFDQALRILLREKIEIRRNSEWLAKLSSAEFIKLASYSTVARMLEREDFSRRYSTGVPIAIHEFFYPLFQGYDSVVLRADIELGGSDQKFNLLMGRMLQKYYRQDQQCILTMPLLAGLDGIEKMSKSKNNAIGISDEPDEMFGKLMSISDELMWNYYLLLSEKEEHQINFYRKEVEAGKNPRLLKVLLAKELVSRFHSERAARQAEENFENRVKGGIPDNISISKITGAPFLIGRLIKQTGLVTSVAEANRNIEQGGVKLNGEVIRDKGLSLQSGEYLLQIGKRRFAKIELS